MLMDEIKALQKERAELLELLLTDFRQYDEVVQVIRRIDQAILRRKELCHPIRNAA